MWVDLPTWGGRSRFRYSGSVRDGTTIAYGRAFRRSCTVSRGEYAALLRHFRERTVNIGTSRDNPPRGSLGQWLQTHVTRTGIVSYVGTILVHEGYAERGVVSWDIRFGERVLPREQGTLWS